MTKLFSEIRFTPAVLVLIAMNLIPLIGVFYFGWDAATIVFLYWIENVVIGVLNIPKILAARGGPHGYSEARATQDTARRSSRSTAFLGVFFAIHYGLFCFGHYLFLKTTYGTLPDFENMFSALLSPVLFWSILGLTFSHIISMIVNFWGRKEYLTQSPNAQMFAPYPRIVLLHIVIIFSGLIAVAIGEGVAMLVALVVLKIIFDLGAHLREHAKIRKTSALEI